MTGSVRLLALLGAILGIFIQAPSAHAQATRTWVSGVGDDVNPCSRTAPCKTFAGAISKTATGGEISVLDPGGFGALTITKAITLDGGGGQVASVLASGTNGIVVNAGSGTVILRNLRINGAGANGANGLDGVVFNSGANLVVENCDIFGFAQNGIHIQSSSGTNHVTILNTTITNNGLGGIQVNPTGGSTNVLVTRSQVNQNAFGLAADSTTGGTPSIEVDRSTFSENTTNGLQASGASTTLQISASEIVHNSTGVNVTSNASVVTFGNNVIAANTAFNINGPSTTAALK